MELKGKKINFLGDSITAGSGVMDKANLYWNRIARETGAVTRGYGIGGTRIARQTKPSGYPVHDQDFIMRVDEMDADADIIVVFGGTNDFGHGDAKLGKMSDRTEYTFYGALHVLCEKLINKYPEALIVFMTPLHRLSEDVKVKEIGIPLETDLEGYVEIEKKVAKYYSIPVLDLFSISGLQPKVQALREKFMPDGLHPNDGGHRIIADRLVGFLKTL